MFCEFGTVFRLKQQREITRFILEVLGTTAYSMKVVKIFFTQ